jgi:streptogramin lyase
MIAPGKFKRYQIPTQNAGPLGICQAPDGSIWFVEASANKIARMTPSGTFKEFAVPTPESGATGIVAGPDGALWFTEARGQVGRMTVSGKFVELPVKGEYYSYPDQITVGSDKNIWFTEQWGFGVLGRIELHDIKKSDPKYLSITLSLKKQPQLGVAQNIPVKVQVRDLHGKIVAGKYPYPVHLTTTDQQNAALSRINVTSSQEAVGVKFSGADSDATIGATANGGARLTPALLVPSTPKEYPLPDDSSDLALGAHYTLWMCLANGNIASRSPDGTIHDYTATGPFSQDGCAIVEAPDGNAWFTDYANDRIGKITPKGKVTFVDLGYHATPYWMVLGSDGALWFTEQLQKKIGRLTTDGKLTTFATQQSPLYIAATPNGNLWFDDEGSLYKMNLKGKQTLIGGIEYYGTPLWSAKGALWYLNDSKLEELDATGKVIGRYEYPRDCAPTDLTTTPDGNLWYYDAGNRCVGRMTPSGVFSTVLTYNRNNGYFNTPGIVYGPKNDIWFDEPGNKGLGWVDPTTI